MTMHHHHSTVALTSLRGWQQAPLRWAFWLTALIICCAALSAPALGGAPVASDRDQRPNIVVILADDLGYGDLSSYGAADLRSPHVDALVRRGMRFDNFYANCPVCSPTRASLLTGCYPELVGVPGVIRTHATNSWGHLDPNAVLLPELLQAAGYRTAIVGKWHLGLEPPNVPNQRGFDHFAGFLGDMMDDYYDHLRHGQNYMRRDRQVIEPDGHATELFSDWACEFLRAQAEAEQPFFLYLAYNAPHTPIQPPDDWLAKVRQRETGIADRRAKLVALIEHMDGGIGRVVEVLEKTGLADNTLVVFTSDNGGQSDVGADNGPLRDGKQSMYEGGLKVPACFVWPDRIAASTKSNRRTLTMDLFPTVCEVAGVDVPQGIDGQSIRPTLLGQEQPPREGPVFFHRREGGDRYRGLTIQAVIDGDWKLLHNSPFEPMELYNLRADPQETTDLAKQHPDVVRRLTAQLQLQIQRGGAVPWQR